MDDYLAEIRLTKIRKELVERLERQQEKGSDVITLTAEECHDLFFVMEQASKTIKGED